MTLYFYPTHVVPETLVALRTAGQSAGMTLQIDSALLLRLICLYSFCPREAAPQRIEADSSLRR